MTHVENLGGASNRGARGLKLRPMLGEIASAFFLLAAAAWHSVSSPAHAAMAQATIGVGVRVIEDCSALLSSSTTIIAASFACQGSPVAMVLSPTVTSTSLSVLAPRALSASASATTSSDDGANTSAGPLLASDGTISVGSPASNFVAATDEADNGADGKIVTITY